jgi:hypothetical protein
MINTRESHVRSIPEGADIDTELQKHIHDVINGRLDFHYVDHQIREKQYPEGYALFIDIGTEGVKPMEVFNTKDKSYRMMCKDNQLQRNGIK